MLCKKSKKSFLSTSFLQEWGCELTKGNLLNSSDIEYALQDIEVVIDAATSRLMQRLVGQMILKVFMKLIGMENLTYSMLANL